MLKKIIAVIGIADVSIYFILAVAEKISWTNVGVQFLLVVLLAANFWQWQNQSAQNLFYSGLRAFLTFSLNVFLFFIPLAYLITQFRQEFSGESLAYFWPRQIFPTILFIFGTANAILYIVKLSKLIQENDK